MIWNRVVAIALLAGAACVPPQMYEATLARSRALEYDREEVLKRLSQVDSQLSDRMREQERLQESQASLQQERVELLEKYENLRSGSEDLRDQLERERTERLAKEQELQSMSGSYKNLVDDLEKEVQNGQIEVQKLQGRLQVRALDQILFDSGSDEIKPEGRKVLDRVAAQIKKIPGQSVRVEGHTDDRPIRKNPRFPSNWELSAARAIRVVRAFQDDGLDPKRLSAVGRGEHQPIDSNDTEKGRSRNRRIEIVLTPDGERERE